MQLEAKQAKFTIFGKKNFQQENRKSEASLRKEPKSEMDETNKKRSLNFFGTRHQSSI